MRSVAVTCAASVADEELDVVDDHRRADDELQVLRDPRGEPLLGVVHGSSPLSSRRNPSASRIGISSSSAFVSFEPAPGPATT